MSKRKITKIIGYGLAICMLALIAIPACTQEQPTTTMTPTTTAPVASGPKTGGILHVNVTGPDTNSPGWPAKQQSGWDTFNTRPADEALARFDKSGAPQPYLAESWDVDVANAVVTVKLKKGIKFQDGTDFNAAAVKWNWEQYVNAGRPEFPKFNSIDVIDDYTLKINMVKWDNTILSAFCLYPPTYVSPTAWQNAPGATTDEERTDWMLQNPVSTGAFMMTDWQRGTKDVYKKNPNYWQQGLPYLDGIEINFIPDPLVAAAAFEAKEIDTWHMPPPASCKTLVDKGLNLIVAPTVTGLWQNWALPNTVSPDSIWLDIKMRQALAYAIDMNAFADSIWMGYATVSNQYALPGTPWYNPDVVGYPYNPEKAKALIAEAGKTGAKVKIQGLNRPTDQLMDTALQGMLTKVGLDVELEMVDTSRFSILVPGQWDSILVPGMQLLADPALRWSATLRTGGFMYANGIMHAEDLDQVIDAARSAPTIAEKQAKIREAQKLFFDKYCIGVPMSSQTAVAAKWPYVKDDGIMVTDQVVWTPEVAWMDK